MSLRISANATEAEVIRAVRAECFAATRAYRDLLDLAGNPREFGMIWRASPLGLPAAHARMNTAFAILAAAGWTLLDADDEIALV